MGRNLNDLKTINMNTRDEVKGMIANNAASWKTEEITDDMADIYVDDFLNELIGKFKLLPIQNVSNFNFEDFAKAILRYDYNELISGKVAVCEKGSNSTIVCYETKEECYNWVLQNYCC